MKILFVAPTVDIKSGWGRFAHALILALKSEGVDCGLALPENSPDELSGVRIYKLLSPNNVSILNPIFLVKNWLALRRVSQNYDLIHFLGEEPYPAATFFSLPKPYMLTVYGTYAVSALTRSLLESIIYKRVFLKSQVVVTISDYTRGEFAKEEKTVKHVILIPPGVDPTFFKPAKLPKSQKKFSILSVGGLTPRKGYDVSLKAVAILAKKFPEKISYTVVAGNRNSEKNIAYFTNLVRETNLENLVNLKLNLSDQDLLAAYHAADVFLLTPVRVGQAFEGFGLVYIEAASCGLPCIGSDSGGAKEAVQDGKNGFVTAEGDVQAVADALSKLIEHPNLQNTMAKNSLSWAANFTWPKVAKKYLTCYENFISI